MCDTVLALADDMTGALEVGAKFRNSGIPAVISTVPCPPGTAPVLVFDTETRHLAGAEAASEIERFTAPYRLTHRPLLIYKKTDSTLRGNIRAELAALARIFPEWRIGYAPAYPALGRTVRGGVLRVHGVAIAETEFAHDLLNPVRTSSISALLDSELACTIFDGENDMHVADAALTILADPLMRIAAGPAGLAEMIARKITLPRSGPPLMPRIRRCLVLNGSRHECSRTQMLAANGAGWRELRRNHEVGSDAASAAAANAGYLAGQVKMESPDAVFVIGGDTAFAVTQALGISRLTAVGEVVPGVPISSTDDGLYLITKAGGFGTPDTIAQVRATLSHD